MKTKLNSGIKGCRLESADTCLILEIDDISTLDVSPFIMAGGEQLRVGDKFTRIDKKGSAGLPPIVLTNGWYQQYEGAINVATSINI